VVIEVTDEPKYSSRVVQARNRREVKAMKMKGRGEKLRVKREGKTEIGVDLMCNDLVQRSCIRAKEGLKGQAGTDFGDEALDDEAAK
jgi:hypothetical protein